MFSPCCYPSLSYGLCCSDIDHRIHSSSIHCEAGTSCTQRKDVTTECVLHRAGSRLIKWRMWISNFRRIAMLCLVSGLVAVLMHLKQPISAIWSCFASFQRSLVSRMVTVHRWFVQMVCCTYTFFFCHEVILMKSGYVPCSGVRLDSNTRSKSNITSG